MIAAFFLLARCMPLIFALDFTPLADAVFTRLCLLFSAPYCRAYIEWREHAMRRRAPRYTYYIITYLAFFVALMLPPFRRFSR